MRLPWVSVGSHCAPPPQHPTCTLVPLGHWVALGVSPRQRPKPPAGRRWTLGKLCKRGAPLGGVFLGGGGQRSRDGAAVQGSVGLGGLPKGRGVVPAMYAAGGSRGSRVGSGRPPGARQCPIRGVPRSSGRVSAVPDSGGVPGGSGEYRGLRDDPDRKQRIREREGGASSQRRPRPPPSHWSSSSSRPRPSQAGYPHCHSEPFPCC